MPGKPLAELGGVPLIVCVARQAVKASGIERVVVATDAPEIEHACAKHGIESVRTRADHPSGTDRVAEAAESVGAAAIINVQGDEPFVDPRDIRAIAGALAGGAPLVSLRAPIETLEEYESTSVVKVVCNDLDQALYFSRAPIPHGLSAETIKGRSYRHIGVYGYGADALRQWTQAPMHTLERAERLEQLRVLAMGIPITMVDADTRGRGIDTPDDLAWARKRVEELGDRAFP